MTARSEGIEQLALPDLERRIANGIRLGTVAEINHAKARVRIRSGEILTAWLPWSTGRASTAKRRWDPPEVGEQVVMLAPGGDLRQAVILNGMFQDSAAAPNASPDKDTTVYGDGTVVEYDRASHTLTVNASASNGHVVVNVGSGTVTVNCQSATVNAADSVTLDTPETHCTGNLHVDGVTTTGGLVSTGEAGGATITGSVAVNGPVSVTGASLTHNGKNVGSTHTHGGVQSGGSTSWGPT